MPRPATVTAPRYDAHPSIAYQQAILDNLPEKTGKSIDEWVAHVKKHGPKGEKERREWLKKECKLGGTTVSMIAEAAAGKGLEGCDVKAYLRAAPGYIETMYGSKPALRPIHDALLELARKLGPDVKVCPCETIVPLYRNHVFAQLKPSTKTRLDLGFALKGLMKKLSPRLVDTGGLQKGDRITHRIPLASVGEIDAEVTEWLRVAYDLDGKD